MKTIVNPENFDKKYLEYLNECFPDWGNKATLDWVINRKVNNQKADFFVIESDTNEVLAGSAISYRELKTQDKNCLEIGIMTGSWTLPISRGMGCFTETIKKSSEIVESKNKHFLTAFVTQTNASFRRLKDAGSFLINTNYIISQSLNNENKSDFLDIIFLENTNQNLLDIFNKRIEILNNKIHFDYNFDDFQNQFVNRLNPVSLLKINNHYAIVEQTPKMFQLHFSSSYTIDLISKIVNWANNYNKELIFFTTNCNNDFISNNNYKIIEGFFTILNNNNSKNLDLYTIFNQQSEFDIQYGDKM